MILPEVLLIVVPLCPESSSKIIDHRAAATGPLFYRTIGPTARLLNRLRLFWHGLLVLGDLDEAFSGESTFHGTGTQVNYSGEHTC